ncbi:GNAT family N-acetyltransferase [Pyxidicoccus fallax]|uniref:GNAT family N-acetyltransferase n=1 Tax=Pyxidicoccus fallax TaxID=394095 RepID=A0A848M1K7_9BACT|nr:GNAT family N-acetyltransferase [Pyxidicoccus fallax]NMO23244.1 GNAT family N-acetyltransferase [Pyxidicoccus fallax]NPC86112.1 GNAT family N-acetyltransferase [Pyxidicoccus fallax]
MGAAGGLHLRPARESDRRTLWRIHTRAVEALCVGVYAPHEVSTWVRLLRPEGYLRPDKPRTVLVAERGRRMVGFGQVDARAGELEALYVVPEEVGHGVGSTLLAALESVAWQAGVPLLGLDASLNAEPFYRHHGYVWLHAARRPLTAEVQLACVRMQKRRPATASRLEPATP